MSIMNINSIKDKISVDFSKDKYEFKTNMINSAGFLNPIGIYGINGSGKTGLLDVFKTLHLILTGPQNSITMFINHFCDGYSRDDDSSLELVFELANTEYEYELKTNFHKNIIVSERLESPRMALVRQGSNFLVIDKSKKEEPIGGAVISDNYSILRQFGNEQYAEDNVLFDVKVVFDYLSAIAHIDYTGQITSSITDKSRINDIMVEQSAKVSDLLAKNKDFPLYDLLFLPLKDKETDPLQEKQMFFAKKGQNTAINERLMSSGMKANSRLLSLLFSMKPGSLLIVDELERSLHPFVARAFLQQFNDKFNIQLIFSSLNTSFLQDMRPDQVFFAVWNNQTFSSVYFKLSDEFPKIREVNNLEKMYSSRIFDQFGSK